MQHFKTIATTCLAVAAFAVQVAQATQQASGEQQAVRAQQRTSIDHGFAGCMQARGLVVK